MGDTHDGIRQMFMIIEHARMMVGTKAIATLSTGYLNALEYAKTRVQGADLAQMADKSAPRVTITHHPDVRRMLMTQKAYAEGMRALMFYAASLQDAAQVADARGESDEATAARNDLLLPLVKGVGSERAYELLTLSLQTFGGSGYLQDYPIEQYIRDAKIDSLYEGTTAIQGMDLFFRKILRNEGAALRSLLTEITEFAAGESGNGRLKPERTALARAAGDVEAMVAALAGYAAASLDRPEELYRAGLNTTRLLMALGDLVIGWLLARQAEVALAALDDPDPGLQRRGQGVLPGQAGHRAVLRPDRAAPARGGARDRRRDHAGPHGASRRGLLARARRRGAGARSRTGPRRGWPRWGSRSSRPVPGAPGGRGR